VTADGTFDLATRLHERGQLSEAERLCGELLRQDPVHHRALHLLGIIAYQRGQFETTLRTVDRAIATCASDPMLFNTRGLALEALGRHDDAIDSYRRCLALLPDFAEAYVSLSAPLLATNRLDEALVALRRAIQLRPDYAEAQNILGYALLHERRPAEALASVDRALTLRPDYVEAHINRGRALVDVGKPDEAIAAYKRALSLQSTALFAMTGIGVAYHAKGNIEQALSWFQRATAANADHPDAHWNLALMLLTLGRLREGWIEYEWRRKCGPFLAHQRPFQQPVWRGEQLAGRAVLIHTEQGFGDMIQFVRYVPLVAARGGRVILECPPELHRLFERLPGVTQTIVRGQTLSPFDLHCPILSLPLAFDTRLENIPANVPYLTIDPEWVASWQARIEEAVASDRTGCAAAPTLRAGVVWAGRSEHPDDADRSIPPRALAFLKQVPGVQWFNLQLARSVETSREVERVAMVDLTADLADFADTAALIAQLDLVITVDTAVAHLAGALGRPVWVLLPLVADWRWLRERSDSPWYPTMRLFRQRKRGDWDEVLQRVAARLTELVENPKQAVAAIEPPTADHRLSQAAAHCRAGRFNETELLCRQILRERESDADACHLLGLVAHAQGRFAEALEMASRACASRPGDANYHHNLAVMQLAAGQPLDAADTCRLALQLQPHFPQALDTLGSALATAKRLEEAIGCYRQALAQQPVLPAAQNHLGLALLESGKTAEAITAFRRAISLRPAFSEAHRNLARALQQIGEPDQAIAALRTAVMVDPASNDAQFSLANALLERGRLNEAIAAYNRSIALNPNDAPSFANLGVAAQRLGDHGLALDSFRRAVQLKPTDPSLHWNLAWALLSGGDFEQGWKEFEWRLRMPKLRLHREFAQPRWDGQDIARKAILLFTEGGFGDAIHFIRYAPMVAARGATVLLECQPELVWLMRSVPGIASVIARGESLPPFDYQAPLQSLPLAFGTTMQDIPAAVPYLAPPPDAVATWRERLAGDRSFKVGLCWSGSAVPHDNRSRSLSIFAPLAGSPNVTFYSLQKGAEANDPAPPGLALVRAIDHCADFADSAALICNLDLIISVDTSVAHLAGALARPVWILIPLVPDFRWLVDREDNPWYPSMRLFRQNAPNDWTHPILRIVERFRARLREQLTTTKPGGS
jgi:tetratricopeptide (TPR) repeat protein